VTLSQALPALSCNTTYHYRAVGASSIGTTNGADRSFTTGSCTPLPRLLGSRFSVQGTYHLQDGTQGALSFGRFTDASAYFSFDKPNDIQAVVKVIDGCGFNSRVWVFVGALTDQEVHLEVKDLVSGQVKSYDNPSKAPWQPVQDTTAFASCPLTAQAGGVAPASLLEIPEQERVMKKALAVCTASSTRLCLNGGRDGIEGTYKLQDGSSGPLHFVALTESSGYFTYADANDVQAIVKVLPECNVDPWRSYWVFIGSATDQEVHVAATDSVTGQVKTYDNALKHVFAPVQDLDGFACAK
jgi:hypothetical protein